MGETDPWIGRVIDGRYRIEAIIGRGGFGAVYRGTHLGLDRPVALKRIRGGDDDLVTRFHREAKLQARLRHPVCVMVHDFVRDDGLWLVQELIDGETLEAVLRAAGPLEPTRAVEITCRLLEGLAAAHALRIVHRDIKPANVMLVRDAGREDVRLLDFGIARAMADEDTCMTSPGVIVGTPRYISPEQARGDDPSPANDIYAVGIVLYYMLAGQPPFRARLMRDAIIAHLSLQPPPLPPEVPPSLAAVVDAALAKSPADRPPSAEAMIDRLRSAARALVNIRPAPPSRPLDPAPPSPTAVDRPRAAPLHPPSPTQTPKASRPHSAYLVVGLALLSAYLAFDATPPGDLALAPEHAPRAATPTSPQPVRDVTALDAAAGDDQPIAASSMDAGQPPPPDATAPTLRDAVYASPSSGSRRRRPTRPRPSPSRPPAPDPSPRPGPDASPAHPPRDQSTLGAALEACRCDDAEALLERLYVTTPRKADMLKVQYMIRCQVDGPKRCP